MTNPAFERLTVALAVTLVTAGGLLGCGEETIGRFRPPFDVVDGTPAVDQALPTIDDRQPTVVPGDFANNAPVQVDVFFQKTVRKVDILWVVDNSCSMGDEQNSLAGNFQSFITDLQNADPPVDYHLGVVTTDATAEGGKLRPLGTDGSKRYISCAGAACNVPNPQAAFTATVQVGTNGGAVEKGLLAAHLALIDPNKSTTNAGFLRDDAALYVVFVSDEGDASCDPLIPLAAPDTDATTCTMGPQRLACRCGDTSLGYGSVDYFVRFFEGLKGFGNEDLVGVAAIVGDDQGTFQCCLELRPDLTCQTQGTCRGCGGTGGNAFYGPRYAEVATRTGGITTTICNRDFSSALSALGFAVSGQRLDFPLSRRPVSPDLSPIRVVLQADPTDPATRQDVPRSTTEGWEYVCSENSTFLNVIRFSGAWVPPPRSRIEVTYQVNVGGGTSCS